MVRLDMSEFSEKHSVAKLIGAAAGYVENEEGGESMEAVRMRPYSLIFFDEIEKAHPDSADILLQIFDDGRLTDNKGRAINLKNTIICVTTSSKNPASDFKPEVLGRLDTQLIYRTLAESIFQKLLGKQVDLLTERLNSKKLKTISIPYRRGKCPFRLKAARQVGQRTAVLLRRLAYKKIC